MRPGSRDSATWLEEAIKATRRWLDKLGDEGGRGPAGRPVRIGAVRPDADRPGWFWLPLRGRTVDVDQVEEAFLAPAKGSEDAMYAVRDSVQDGEVLRVLVMAGAPSDGLYLWAPPRNRTVLLQALVDRLGEVGADGVHGAFGRRRLDPVEPCRVQPAGLDPYQLRAFAACVGRGLNMVWGPPGTGKTQVIARAIEHLVRDGKSVLLVSGTNVAVDNALDRAARSLRPDEHGVMVRVGTPSVQRVGDDPRLSLSELRKRRLQAKEEERAAVERQILEWEADPALRKLRRAEERLKGFEPAAYAEACRRVENEERLREAEARWLEAERTRTKLEAEVTQAAARLSAAEARHAESSGQLTAIAEVQRLTEELEGQRLAQVRAKARLIEKERKLWTVEQEAAALSELRRKNKRRRVAEKKVADVAAALERTKATLAQCDEFFATAGPAIERRIHELAADVGDMTPGVANRLNAELTTSRQALDAAEELKAQVEARVTGLRAVAERAGTAPRPTTADRDLIARADAGGLSELHERLPRLRERAARAIRRIEGLTRAHERLVRALRELGRDAERAIVAEAKVVATTLSMLRLRDGVYGRPYDVVIVDEAAASTLPELVQAVSLARTGAVMLGDFLQNAPIVEGVDGSAGAEVREWLLPDCFAFFGVHGATSRVAGCVALCAQRRFGESINELANMVAYDGMLRTAPSSPAPTSRIVFVDVDGLGAELAMIRDNPGGRGKWWAVGALLARAITQYHVEVHKEEGAGVVTPYRVQKEIIDAMLADAGADTGIEVATSHGFQGREFDTIVFDLVEAGDGWVARGSRDGGGWELGGLRLFNVGVTRARRNLYLIGNGVALKRATSGPLHAVARLIACGTIEVVAARDILGVPEPEIQKGARYELWDAIRKYVKVAGIYDEDTVPGELVNRIREARSSVWIWSPWVGRRVDDFLPELRAATDRGVAVRVLVLPLEQVRQPLHPFVNRLREQLDHVVYVEKEHRKLIIIDRRLTFIGSMNLLSHPGGAAGRREVMTLIESADFAERMLRHERADQFTRPPSCPECQDPMRAAALSGSGAERGWRWWCYNPRSDATTCKAWLPFPKDPAGRNQPSPRRRRPPGNPSR